MPSREWKLPEHVDRARQNFRLFEGRKPQTQVKRIRHVAIVMAIRAGLWTGASNAGILEVAALASAPQL